ncbi:MAG: hypothetical protein NC231_12685 [Bacillus sp. (in: Bacteria)]|nr:hypothetical protein [Bacillus sp. (in: firmicutes)]MCM1427778.1 hypothetical protein [Eubacterium sp.]
MKTIEERLREYGRNNAIGTDEVRMRETLINAKRLFYESAERKEVSYLEFFCGQIGYIRKRWWMLQFLALVYTGCLLQGTDSAYYIQRLLGVSASLFVIMIIPELWKNRSSQSLEIEEASRFTLRQIYAVRMLAFVIVDSALLTLFAGIVTMTTTVSIGEMVIHFFLPMAVTCCICFHALCSRYAASEYTACFLSMLWSAVWTLLILNDNVYKLISRPAWTGICIIVILYLTCLVKKAVKGDIGELLSQ